MVYRVDYYSADELTAWERVKQALANDWEQTKADLGSDASRDMDQDVDDTIRQMAGADDAFENREQALRFGFIAQRRYQAKYPEWGDELDDYLRSEYYGDYDDDRPCIRYAYLRQYDI